MSLSLNEIRNVILLFSNPSWPRVNTVSDTVVRNISALSGPMAYSARFAGNTTILSNRYAGTSNGIVQGLLYVPDLPPGHSCVDETAPHVPLSVVRQANLPPINFHMVAIAPWVNERCSEAYLAAVRGDPIRAFIFYMPGNTSASPPPADSPEWHIEDTSEWLTQIGHPVYAVSATVGEIMMQHLSLYSGNMTEVPFGQNITERFSSDPKDYLRIWTELVITSPDLPFGNWVYLLAIVGVLLTVIATISLLMHLVQARRRARLRRRVVAGEVNLEAMGIARLTIPPEHIHNFPLFTYYYEPDTTSPPQSPQLSKSTRTRTKTCSLDQTKSVTTSRVSRPGAVSVTSPGGGSGSGPFSASTTATNYQPRCEICLDPYQNRTTIIRELTCGHIFHPECIDDFLVRVSSLCPVCKASMLPAGFCPTVTNTMVRRERAIRRLRGRIDVDAGPGRVHTWWASARDTVLLRGDNGSRPASPSTELQETATRGQQQPQMRPSGHYRQVDSASAGPPGASATVPRELAGFEPDYGEGGRTRWKRVRNRIFPGFQ